MYRMAFLLPTLMLAMADEGGTGAGTETTAPADGAVIQSTALSPETNETRLDAISKVLPSVKFYDDYKTAIDAVMKAGKETENFFGIPVIIKGYNEETEEVDESVYNGMLVRVGTLTERVDVGGKGRNGVIAITVLPVPRLESILEADGGKDWIAKISQKELGLVAYRSIRGKSNLPDLMNGVAKMPSTVEEFLTESKRAGSAGDTETFDTLWKDLLAGLKKQLPALEKALPNKVETIKCIRSKSYADQYEHELENMPQGSAFVKLAQITIAAAKNYKLKDGTASPLPTDAIEDWLAGRDTLPLTREGPKVKDYDALKDLDFSAFAV